MKRLKEKLKNSDGASLLLSLLVFLLCVMVAASVLAAAVSNAGKTRSSRVEQQRYQTLSSALSLICGEIEKVEYVGKYQVSSWTAGGVEYFYCQQQNGEFKMQGSFRTQTFKLAEFSFMSETLKKEMDEVFRQQFQKTDGSGDAEKGYGPLPDDEVITADAAAAADPIRLTVTLPDGLPGYPYADGTVWKEYQLPKTVNVEIKLDHNNNDNNKKNIITLTAWLDDTGAPPAKGSSVMVAKMKADIVPKPEIPPGKGADKSDIPSGVTPTDKTLSVQWTLDGMSMTVAP